MAQNKFAFSIPDLAVKKLLLQEESSIFKKAICMSSSRCFPWWLQSCWWNSLLEEFFLLRHLVSLLVLKLPLIKAAKCTFSDWKRYINLVSGNVNLIPSKCLALQSYSAFLVLIMLATRKSTIEQEQSPFHNPFKPNSRKTSFV